MEKYTLAAFDFDGTITTKDTLFDFILFYHGRFRFVKGLVILSPLLLTYKLGFVKNSTAKEKLFSYFFRGQNFDYFNGICLRYADRISRIGRQETLERINRHRKEGHQLIIVSASITNWIEPWASNNGFEKVIGTEIEVDNNIITGRFSSENCYGKEKVIRLLQKYPKRDDYILYAYGDSRGDKELLELADYPILIKRGD